jgi:hypothetical protein
VKRLSGFARKSLPGTVASWRVETESDRRDVKAGAKHGGAVGSDTRVYRYNGSVVHVGENP